MSILDFAAVERLRDEPVDWRYKGLPPDASTVDDLVGRRVPDGGFTSPVAVLVGPALYANLDRYAQFCAERGLDFAPHIKTTMAPQLAAEQARRGAWGFTVANVAQARVLRAFGARRILIAHGVVDPASVAWLAAEQEHAEVYCWVDSPSTVDALSWAGTWAGPARRRSTGYRIPVFVELGAPGGRTGARGPAAAVEGDRERGTLATLQVTRLSAAEIALGKLLAGWGVGLAALALTLPFVGWAVAEGGMTPLRTFVVLLVVALLIGVVCAVSLGLSALLARSITSALLSYVAVFALTVGTVVAFGLSAGVIGGDRGTSKVWWMLAPNPFVVLADATPKLPPVLDERGHPVPQPTDPLGELGRSVRQMRAPDYYDYEGEHHADPGPVWPYGLTFDLLLGAGAVWVTARQLRTPAERLPRGVRVA